MAAESFVTNARKRSERATKRRSASGRTATEVVTVTNYRIGDPVVDLAQGRPMVVLDVPDQTVAEWSDANGYDLQGNYANGKFDPADDEGVVECVYVSDVRSEPSKSYTFPVSRLALIDAHHADDGRRLYDRVVRDVLERLFTTASRGEQSIADDRTVVASIAEQCYPSDLVDEAEELADVEQRFGGDDE